MDCHSEWIAFDKISSMAFQPFPFIIYGLLLTRYLRSGNPAFFFVYYIWIGFDKISYEWHSTFFVFYIHVCIVFDKLSSEWHSTIFIRTYGLLLKYIFVMAFQLFSIIIYGMLLTRYLRSGKPSLHVNYRRSTKLFLQSTNSCQDIQKK